MDLTSPKMARVGDKIAVVSPSFAAPAVAPVVHEQALKRLQAVTGLVPVEFPTTRKLNASARERADDLNAAFADPEIRAVLATIGGHDQITVIPHLDPTLIAHDPKPFLGYSDNTNLLNWLWTNGVAGYYGGSTQIHLGPGPHVDPVHEESLRAALLTGVRVELTEPGESEDIGHDWNDPRALTEFGDRGPTEPWAWSGPSRSITGRTWGGCIEILQWILTAGRFPTDPSDLDGGVTTSRVLRGTHPRTRVRLDHQIARRARNLERRGRRRRRPPPTSDFDTRPSAEDRRAKRAEQRDRVTNVVHAYNPEAVVVVGPPFGHTRPQWIVPYGGFFTVDGVNRRVYADYS